MKVTHSIMRVFFALIMTLFTLMGYAQIPSFYSDDDVKEYFRSHILDLDPIEGIWEGCWTRNSNSPYANADGDESTWFLVKGNDGWIYNIDEDYKIQPKGIRFRRIGETNNYRWELLTSSGIVTIDSPFSVNIRFDVNSADAKVWAGNKNFRWKVWLNFNMAKDFPTRSMYAQAFNQIESNGYESSDVKNWSGTGFALNDGYIVTNYHVIDGANTITVQGVKGNFSISYNATVVGTDRNNDLALLKISDSSFSGFGSIPYSISNVTSEVGEEVFVLGYPLTSTMGDEIKLTTGIISSKTGFQGDVALYQISAPIQPGNSGGPLFDKKGNVIGIVSAKHAGAENVGYAIKSLYLRNLIESSANSAIIPTNNSVSTLPLTGKVKAEKNYVFFIQCSTQARDNAVSSQYQSSNVNIHNVTI